MNIIESIRDPQLFRGYLADDSNSLKSWARWMTCLRVIHGLPLTKKWQRRLVRQCTGRDPDKLPKDGFKRVLLLCGRRSGKSKIGGLICGFEGTLSGREKLCSPGELPMISICSPTKDQSQIIKSYTRAALGSDMLSSEVTDDNRDLFKLANGVTVRILTGSFRHVRSFTQIAVVVDEVCFFGSTEESAVRSDTELIRSIRPSLLTTGGRLICISTKYAPKGWAYSTWKRHFGKDNSRVLVWDADSRTMNPTLSQDEIDAEIAEDPEAARAEFLNHWREDVQTYLPREVVEACVVSGRRELLYDGAYRYVGFADVSGGRGDPMALSIGHTQKGSRMVIIDCLRQWKPPCNPLRVVEDMANVLKRYRVPVVWGDRYAAEFNTQTFRNNGIRYVASDKSKSELYLNAIGPICSKEVELLDDEQLITQLSSLERRTRSGGRDSVDHPSGQHDDSANVVCGVVSVASRPQRRAGGWRDGQQSGNPRARLLRELRENNARVSVLE